MEDNKKERKMSKKDKKGKKDEELEGLQAEDEGPLPVDDDGGMTEVLDQEPRNILLSLLSQVRIGMDLSRVTLPTFILEPKSFLEKLTDFMTHPSLIVSSPKLEDPVDRFLAITKWYMSGFYIRPKGVKKPYNPILGEIFRASWHHDESSKSFFVAEQVSHHPPVSAFYASNRKNGLVMNGSIHFRSKFMGNSTAAILDGEATLHLLHHNEQYIFTFPSAIARGILWGTLLMELGGNVTVRCPENDLKAEIEFKTKPFFGGDYNVISGKIIEGKKKTLYTLSGKWDKQIFVKEQKAKKSEVFWDPVGVPKEKMLIRPLKDQEEFESRKLWHNVTQALVKGDQETATDEKCKLEDAQRQGVIDRDRDGVTYEPRLFRKEENGDWVYKYINLDPKFNEEEEEEVEEEGIIQIKSKAELSQASSSE
ncbi:oxysterol-binding protein-related protein 5 isoform X3, variant 2 [Balamuthia mandrillaris]